MDISASNQPEPLAHQARQLAVYRDNADRDRIAGREVGQALEARPRRQFVETLLAGAP